MGEHNEERGWGEDSASRSERLPDARAIRLSWWGGAPVFVFLCLFLMISGLRLLNGEIASTDAPGYLLWLGVILAVMLVPGRIMLMVTRSQAAANGMICGVGWFVLWVGLVFLILTTPVDHLSQFPNAVASKINETGRSMIESARERRAREQAEAEAARQARQEAEAPTDEQMEQAIQTAKQQVQAAQPQDQDSNPDDASVALLSVEERDSVRQRMLRETTAEGLELYQRHRGAMEQLLQVGGIDTAWLTDKAQIEKQLAATRALSMVNQRMLEHLDSLGAHLEKRMSEAGFTPQEIAQIAPEHQLEVNLEQVLQICHGLGQVLDDNRSALILLRQHWGLWQLADGQVLWQRDFYASERYEKLRQNIESHMTDIQSWHADLTKTLSSDQVAPPADS